MYCEKIVDIKVSRPELNRLINDLEIGDTVIIANLKRISRRTKDAFEIVDKIKTKEFA